MLPSACTFVHSLFTFPILSTPLVLVTTYINVLYRNYIAYFVVISLFLPPPFTSCDGFDINEQGLHFGYIRMTSMDFGQKKHWIRPHIFQTESHIFFGPVISRKLYWASLNDIELCWRLKLCTRTRPGFSFGPLTPSSFQESRPCFSFWKPSKPTILFYFFSKTR